MGSMNDACGEMPADGYVARGHRRAHILIINPGAEVYGSDLQMLESVGALVAAGALVTVIVPENGPLRPLLVARGARVRMAKYPVLRRRDASAIGLASLALRLVLFLPWLVITIRRLAPTTLYVNTVTLPWCLLAGRMAGVRTVCHVHEAEARDSRVARLALYGPLVLAHLVIMNGEAARRCAVRTVASVGKRSLVVPNGVPDRPHEPAHAVRGSVLRLGVIGRLSPRKRTLDALEAAAMIRANGRNVELHVYGSTFEGYEWYERELRERAARSDLDGSVHFHGYCRPVWPALDALDVVVAPSSGESVGNNVIEAQLSLRPVVASRVEGHNDVIEHGRTGLLTEVGVACALAQAVEQLAADETLSRSIACAGRESAVHRHGIKAYADSITVAVLGGSGSDKRVRSGR